MSNGIEEIIAEGLLNVFGSHTFVGLVVLGLIIIWLIFSKMDRGGILFVSFLTIGTLHILGYIPLLLYGVAVLAAGAVWSISMLRMLGEQ